MRLEHLQLSRELGHLRFEDLVGHARGLVHGERVQRARPVRDTRVCAGASTPEAGSAT